jgi:hypothetical protein
MAPKLSNPSQLSRSTRTGLLGEVSPPGLLGGIRPTGPIPSTRLGSIEDRRQRKRADVVVSPPLAGLHGAGALAPLGGRGQKGMRAAQVLGATRGTGASLGA